METRQRPLSPHIGIYRPQITSVLSILHRMTGIALAFGAILLTFWLSAAAYGPEAFSQAQKLMGSLFGRLILFGLTFSLVYHLCNGIRHLAWDIGWGFELSKLRATGWIVLIASIFATGVIWVLAYKAAGLL